MPTTPTWPASHAASVITSGTCANDYYSHAAGDALLVAVARRIRDNIRPGDTLARISGDEFLLLLDPLHRLADLAPVVDRVVAALKLPFAVDGHELLSSASVGASVVPLHGATDEALRRCADTRCCPPCAGRAGVDRRLRHRLFVAG